MCFGFNDPYHHIHIQWGAYQRKFPQLQLGWNVLPCYQLLVETQLPIPLRRGSRQAEVHPP